MIIIGDNYTAGAFVVILDDDYRVGVSVERWKMLYNLGDVIITLQIYVIIIDDGYIAGIGDNHR